MRIKKLFTTFALAASLALAVPAVSAFPGVMRTAAAESETPSTETKQTETPSTETKQTEAPSNPDKNQTAESDGWHQDAQGNDYYISNGSRVKGQQTIGGKQYYFDAKGNRVTGTVKIGSRTYLYHPETGVLVTGKAGLFRFKSEPDVYYYFASKKNGVVAARKWVQKNGQYYYANDEGKILLGTVQASNGRLYHITRKGRLTSYKKSSVDGKYYYAASNGKLKTGRQKINNKLYYFSPTTGERMTGSVKIGDYYYYFEKKSGYAKTGWVKSNGKYYYYSSKYHRLTGFQTINKKKYYLNPDEDGARVAGGWITVNGNEYYFNEKGVLQTGLFKVGGDTYYADSNGVRKTGWQTVKSNKYYMDPTTGVMRTGWLTYKGKKYYLNPVTTGSTYGAAKTGWVQIKSAWYYFNDDGAMRTGWLVNGNKYYYLDKDTGKMYTGKHTIDGKVYDFGTSGAYTKALTGEWRIEVNRKNCFVVVYRGTTAVKAFVCSTALDGVSTPVGTFTIQDKLRWHELNGPSWGQYCSHITSDILFHSVPNLKPFDNHSLNAAAYNKLGTKASGGCIRLTVKSAKWLYDNCPIGTKVVINDNVAKPTNGVEIEKAPKIPVTQNYDPTDPNA